MRGKEEGEEEETLPSKPLLLSSPFPFPLWESRHRPSAPSAAGRGRGEGGGEATPPHSSISQVLDLGPKGGERKEQSFAGRKKREGENQKATFTFPLAAESGQSGSEIFL